MFHHKFHGLKKKAFLFSGFFFLGTAALVVLPAAVSSDPSPVPLSFPSPALSADLTKAFSAVVSRTPSPAPLPSSSSASTASAASSVASAASQDAPVGWEKMGDSDGIAVFKKEVPGDPILAVRGEGVVAVPILRVASVIFDDERATEWVDSLASSKLLKMYGDREFLEYSHIGTPFVMKDRDFLTRGLVDVNAREQTITMSLHSVTDPLMPPGNYVRGTLDGYWKMRSIENGSQTYVIAEMHADPKGVVPKWIVNLFQKGWAKDTIQSLRKQVAKPDIKLVAEAQKISEEFRMANAKTPAAGK